MKYALLCEGDLTDLLVLLEQSLQDTNKGHEITTER